MSNLPPRPAATTEVASSNPMLRFSLDALASALAAAGLGLLIWMGVSVALLQMGSGDLSNLRGLHYTGLILGCVLAAIGVINLRACPEGSGVNWRQITAAALVLTLASALATVLLLAIPTAVPGWTALAAALSCIGAVCSLLGLGMCRTEGSREDWHKQMVAPNFLAYALLAGACLLFALIALKWQGQKLLSAPAPSLITLVLIVAATKFVYWTENSGLRSQLPGVPATWALPLRGTVLALLAVIPLLLVGAIVLWPHWAPRAGWCAIALSVLAAGYLERQLLALEAGLPGTSQTPVHTTKSP